MFSRHALLLVLAAPPVHLSATQAAPTPSSPCVASAPYPCATPESLGLERAPLEQFSADIQGWINNGLLVGAELLVVKDRQIAWHVALGQRDLELGLPLERNSMYRIRSMTKPFTGAAVLMLAEEGRLSLDDAVATHLPSFDNTRSGNITIRHLLAHTSGIGAVGWPEGFWDAPNLREAVKLIGARGPAEPVGESYRYTDLNSAVLGAIVAEVTGEPVEDVIRARILEPLDLTDTHMHFSPDSAWADRMNSTHVREDDGTFRRSWDSTQEQGAPWFRGSGGMYSSVFDYARWLDVWMNKGRVGDVTLLRPETITAALEPNLEPTYGLHMQVFFPGLYEADGLPVFGHGGVAGTTAMAFPSRNAVVLVFTQSQGAPPSAFIPRRFPSLLGL